MTNRLNRSLIPEGAPQKFQDHLEDTRTRWAQEKNQTQKDLAVFQERWQAKQKEWDNFNFLQKGLNALSYNQAFEDLEQEAKGVVSKTIKYQKTLDWNYKLTLFYKKASAEQRATYQRILECEMSDL